MRGLHVNAHLEVVETVRLSLFRGTVALTHGVEAE